MVNIYECHQHLELCLSAVHSCVFCAIYQLPEKCVAFCHFVLLKDVQNARKVFLALPSEIN